MDIFKPFNCESHNLLKTLGWVLVSYNFSPATNIYTATYSKEESDCSYMAHIRVNVKDPYNRDIKITKTTIDNSQTYSMVAFDTLLDEIVKEME